MAKLMVMILSLLVVTSTVSAAEGDLTEYERCQQYNRLIPADERVDCSKRVEVGIAPEKALRDLTRYLNCREKAKKKPETACLRPRFLKGTTSAIPGCAGAEMSPDLQRITCANGNVYYRSRATSSAERSARKPIKRRDGRKRNPTTTGFSENQ